MKIEEVQKEEITLLTKEFDNYIIYYFDSLKFGKGFVDLDMDNINEAFFFKEGKCMHIYREDGIKGILYIEQSDKFILEKQFLEERILKEPIKTLVVKKYIEFDEDGQAYISRTLPSTFE